MTLFLDLLLKLLPVYSVIALGYVANRFLDIKKESIAKVLIYVIFPVVSFAGVMVSEINAQLVSIPLLAILLCSVVCFILLLLGKTLWKDGTKNVLSAGIANGNFGFIGLPLTLSLLGPSYVPLTAIFGIGGGLFLATVGAYVTARGRYSVSQSVHKVLRIPTLYTFTAAIILKLLSVTPNQELTNFLLNFNAAYSVMGLLLIGIVLAELKKTTLDLKLISFSVVGTFLIWPLVALLFVWLDSTMIGFYPASIHKVIILMSLVPTGASIVGFATELGVEPEKASLAVVTTTIVSIFFIPLAIFLLTNWDYF